MNKIKIKVQAHLTFSLFKHPVSEIPSFLKDSIPPLFIVNDECLIFKKKEKVSATPSSLKISMSKYNFKSAPSPSPIKFNNTTSSSKKLKLKIPY